MGASGANLLAPRLCRSIVRFVPPLLPRLHCRFSPHRPRLFPRSLHPIWHARQIAAKRQRAAPFRCLAPRPQAPPPLARPARYFARMHRYQARQTGLHPIAAMRSAASAFAKVRQVQRPAYRSAQTALPRSCPDQAEHIAAPQDRVCAPNSAPIARVH